MLLAHVLTLVLTLLYLCPGYPSCDSGCGTSCWSNPLWLSAKLSRGQYNLLPDRTHIMYQSCSVSNKKPRLIRGLVADTYKVRWNCLVEICTGKIFYSVFCCFIRVGGVCRHLNRTFLSPRVLSLYLHTFICLYYFSLFRNGFAI